ncbi:MAG: HAMP domain-containing histidine kinase [Coriobacteriia bacterium]|nr:HAMP domain-containing histidine kinase [Coriobacteriia bacterium]
MERIAKNTMRARIARVLRRDTFVVALITALAGIVAPFVPWMYWWTIPLLVGLVAWFTVFWLARSHSRNALAEYYNALDTITEFAHGNKEVRVRSAGARDVRQLADTFNKIALENERVLKRLEGEDARQTQFVSDVSHEIKTPLTAVRGNAELMLATPDMPREDQERFLQSIADEADRLGRLASDLRTLQRIEGATGEIKLRSFNPLEAVQRAEHSLESIFKLHKVTFSINGEAPDILGDRDRVQQVVVNLVDNATRIVGPGGKVWVELATANRSDIDQRLVRAHALEVDTYALIAVCDDGPGVPEEDIPKLFDRFHRTDQSRDRNTGGWGLGLSIVKAIVDTHGGVIEVQRRIQRGMQFSVYLPVPPEFDSDVKWSGWRD